jgi:nucleoside-diphosphate-sugar epimerase
VVTVALTGATGFIGRHIAATLRGRGHRVRALVRRRGAVPDRDGVSVVPGSLEDDDSLAELLRGAGAVVHAAGVVKASCRSAYRAANADGTARLARRAAERGCRSFVLVSSLAARQPGLSRYAESKAMGEHAALRLADRLALTIVRPPAVYGPGDRSTLPVLRGLSRGWLPAPAGAAARFSLLFVTDLARLIPALLDHPPGPSGAVLEPDDGRDGGYSWRDLAAAAEAALGRRVRLVELPKRPLAALGGLLELSARASGRLPALSRDKVEELFHPDWVCDAHGLAAVPGWRPAVDLGAGLRSTLAWYRDEGWL